MRKLLYAILIGILTFNLTQAQEEEYISLYVYNFVKYFDWPESAKYGNFTIEVLGHKSVYLKLKDISAGKKVGNQNIVVKNYTTLDQMGKPHILFIGYWHTRLLPDVIKRIGNSPTLIITEKEGLIKLGSAINFIIVDNEIKFELSKKNITSHKIKVDPRLGQLAHIVYE
jgi:hypothetical protein